MNELEKLGEELLQGERGAAIRAAADSAEAQALSKKLDPAAVERAARSGDGEQLRAVLQSVLSTEEGRALAEKLSRLR